LSKAGVTSLVSDAPASHRRLRTLPARRTR
jgi:hypothetical protein